MIIKAYGDLPRMYAPDIGEVLLARRGPSDKLVRAVVLDARRNRSGHLRVKVQWLEDDPDAGVGDYNRPKVPIVAGTTHAIIINQREGEPPLIRQINRGAAAKITPETGTPDPS